MFTEHTVASNAVKSTAPILEEHGETLTRHFYKRMFEKNPEVAPFFQSLQPNSKYASRRRLPPPSAPMPRTSTTSKSSAVRSSSSRKSMRRSKSGRSNIRSSGKTCSPRFAKCSARRDLLCDLRAGLKPTISANIFDRSPRRFTTSTSSRRTDGQASSLSRSRARLQESEVITSFYLGPCRTEARSPNSSPANTSPCVCRARADTLRCATTASPISPASRGSESA